VSAFSCWSTVQYPAPPVTLLHSCVGCIFQPTLWSVFLDASVPKKMFSPWCHRDVRSLFLSNYEELKNLQRARVPRSVSSGVCSPACAKINFFYYHTVYQPSLTQSHPPTLLQLKECNFDSSANFDLFPAV